MIKNYTNFINENLLDYMKGPSNEEVWKKIRYMNLNDIYDDNDANYNLGEFIDKFNPIKKEFFLMKLRILPPKKILNISTKLGFLGGIKLAIKKGCDNYNIISSINIAAKNNNLHILKYFIEDLNMVSDINNSNNYNSNTNTMSIAAVNGHFDIVKYLVEHGIRITNNTLENIIKRGSLDMLKYLIENGVKVTSESLNIAVLYGHLDVVEYLVEYGTKKDANLLYQACIGKNIDIIKYLFQKFEFNEIEKKQGVEITIRYNNLNILKCLVEHNVIIDASSVRFAYSLGYSEIADYIIKTFNISDEDIINAKKIQTNLIINKNYVGKRR